MDIMKTMSLPVKTVAGLCDYNNNIWDNPISNHVIRKLTPTVSRTPAVRSSMLQGVAHQKVPSYPPREINPKAILPRSRKKIRRDNLTTVTTASNNNRVTDVLRLMDGMQFPIPTNMYASLLKECIDLKDVVGGAEVHAHINNLANSTCSRSIIRHQPPSLPAGLLSLANRLLLMYASCGHLNDARNLFDKMVCKDSISWLIMIAANVDHNAPAEALYLFNQMLMRIRMQQPQPVDQQKVKLMMSMGIPSVLKACIQTEDFGLGKQVHGLVFKLGQAEDLILCTSFIGFYGKSRGLEDSQRVFDQVLLSHHNCDTVIWTAIMVAYCKEGHFKEVLKLFKKMGRAGTKKNSFTISTVLRACGRIRGDDENNTNDKGRCGRQVHANAIKIGVVDSDLYVQCGLVDMYGKYGLLEDSRMVFDQMIGGNRRSNVCWNAMLNSYTQNGSYNEAIKLLYLMKSTGIQPPESIVNTLRVACGGS